MNYQFHRTYRGTVQAVVLDWAGTAVDYGSFAPTAVFLRLFESQGVRITAAQARSGMGLMKKDHLRTILACPSVTDAWEQTHGGPASEADVDELFKDFVPLQLTVLRDFAAPIPGLVEVVQGLREKGVKIGSTTGYIRAMMEVLQPAAKEAGYEPDCVVCPDDVPAGRPLPWMCYQNAMQLGVYPMQSMVKVGDTLVDIEEGLNAGMWTVGVSQTGNLLGRREEEINSLGAAELAAHNEAAAAELYRAGAHYVIDGIWGLPSVLDAINQRLLRGEMP